MKTKQETREEQKSRTRAPATATPPEKPPAAFYLLMGALALALVLFLGMLLFAL